MFGFINPDDLPEEVRNHIEWHRAQNQSTAHEIVQLIEQIVGMGERQGLLFRGLLSSLEEVPQAVHYYIGLVTGELDNQHGICRACGEKHDEELAIIIEAERLKMTDSGDLDKEDSIDWLDFLLAPENVANINEHWQEFTSAMNVQLPQLAAHLSLFSCNLLEKQWPKVRCICGMEYPSLKDRMRREPGVEGCSGCQQKGAWG